MNKLLAGLLALTPIITFAAGAYARDEITEGWGTWAGANLVPLILLAAVCVVLFAALATLGSLLEVQHQREAISRGEQPLSVWQRMSRALHNPAPLELEQQTVLDHSYDGIRELDNAMPPWWLYSFYASIAFAVIYMAVFAFSDTSLRQMPEYETEMAEAKISVDYYLSTQANLVDENNAELLSDIASLTRGKEVFDTYCTACHAADGGGGVGPNLTDDYWLHGDGSIRPLFATVKHGVPEKGMIAWKTQLSAAEIHEVSSYVATLHGTTPAEPKEPQGDLAEVTMPATDFTTRPGDQTITADPSKIEEPTTNEL